MNKAARARLIEIAQDVMQHAAAKTFRTAESTMTLPASMYTDQQRFQDERTKLFRRVPLMLAASCELRNSGDYKTMDVAGVPILLTRDRSGVAHALVNICTHRGAPVASGAGNATRFVCPYHGWTYGIDGRLAAVASAKDFGEIDKACFAMRRLPVHERYGLIWVTADPAAVLETDRFLGDFGEALGGFGFESWHLVERREMPGANWKLAFDAHLEFYHLPVLHRNTFGPTTNNQALYFFNGPHERLIRPIGLEKPGITADADIFQWCDRPVTDWPIEAMLLGEWILFPNVSINSFYTGGRGVLISQILPGATVGESITIQSYFMQNEPDAEQLVAVRANCEFLARVVRDEDLTNSYNQQRALGSGLLKEVCFGRNEAGGQHFHCWLDAVLATPDDALNTLFTDHADQPLGSGRSLRLDKQC